MRQVLGYFFMAVAVMAAAGALYIQHIAEPVPEGLDYCEFDCRSNDCAHCPRLTQIREAGY